MATAAVGILVVVFSAWHSVTVKRRLVGDEARPTSRVSPPPRAIPAQNNLAMRYARAVQDGNCAIVIPHTAWMRERLKRALEGKNGNKAVERVRSELCDRIQRRTPEGNQLRREGVEDQYVFAPGVRLEVVREDAGRSDLEEPVKRRTWIRATFPTRPRALSDEAGRPIRSMVVGVNLSPDGCVVKANVIGNLEIDPGSLRYNWPATSTTGG